MRTLFVLIVVAALAFLALKFQGPLISAAHRVFSASAEKSSEPPSPLEPAPPLLAPTAAPGVYYALERVTNETKNGLKALNRGEEVRLMYRHKDGRMLVTNGRDEFTVKPSSLTRNRSQIPPATPH